MPSDYKRIPLASLLTTRDATLTKDGLLTNCYHESSPTGDKIVKRAGLFPVANVGFGCAQGSISYNGAALVIQNDTIYEYVPGGWLQTSTSFSGSGFSMAGLGSTIFAISDASSYSSTNGGYTWTTLVAPAWVSDTPLHGTMKVQSAVAFNGLIYAVVQTSSTYTVWSTSDCIGWTKTSTINPSGVSPIIGLVVFGGSLYLFAGENITSKDYVYSSANGSSWSLLNSATVWNTNAAAPVVFGSAMYVIAAPNSVFVSVNGSSWAQLTSSAAFGTLSGQPAVWSNSTAMYVGGGQFSASSFQFFSSIDGINWTSLPSTNSSPITSRFSPGYTSFNNVFWVMSGKISNIFSASGVFTYPGIFPFPAGHLPPNACEPYTMALIPAQGSIPISIFLKNADVAYYFNTTTSPPGFTFVQITSANYPATTVPGVVFLDGSVYVMAPNGQINGSAFNDMTTWSALNFVTAQSEAGNGVYLARQLDYIVAFKQFSTEFFYDAGNATGSPLGAVQSAFLKTGCASAGSVAFRDSAIYFMSQERQKGRQISLMVGYQPQVVSTPFIDRLLDADDLATVDSFFVKINGHNFYVITLGTSNLTLAYDEITQEWARWTSLVSGATISASSATVQTDGSILIATGSPHGLSDGDPVAISGSTTAGVNGTFPTFLVNNVQFYYYPLTTVTGPISGSITVTEYTEQMFTPITYASGGGIDLLVDATTGAFYSFSPTVYRDNLLPIDCKMRTPVLDFGTMKSKRIDQVELVGDNENTSILVHYSDDDYQTFSAYENLPMSYDRALLTCQGSTRRRAYELRHVDNQPLRLEALEAMIDLGAF